MPPPTVGQARLGKAAPAASLLLWDHVGSSLRWTTSQLRFRLRAVPSAIEQGQRRPGHTLEQGAIRVRARQNANAKHHAEQQSRRVLSIHCGGHRSRRLGGHDVAAEERGDLVEVGGNAGAKLRVVGRNLEGGVHQQASAAVRIGNRALDRVLDEGANGRLGVVLALEPRDPLTHRARGVSLECPRKQCPLVAECIVETGALDAHVLGQVAHRCRFQPAAPKAGDGGIQRLVLVE